ncbi:MAG: response regulator transcription factor [Myxococcales bacterium]|nr:response regulator transcription factor [Myxococcales bacterium]
MSTRVLLAEDDEHIARGLCFNFEAHGYEVEWLARGDLALARLLDQRQPLPDLIILDVMLPGLSGLEVLRELRERESRVPVLLLTALDSEREVVAGLDLGADDYLTKPFSLPVLLARMRTLLRRGAQSQERGASESFWIGEVAVYPERFEVEREGERLPLTAKELGLLCLLNERRGKAVSRGEILQEVWGLHPKTRTRVVDTFILRLRKLVERDSSEPRYIVSVRSYGYRLRDDL